MSVFGPNQVEELIIGDVSSAQGNVKDFVDNAAVKEIKVVARDGGAAGLNKPFYLLQKTAGNAGRNLNYEFSDEIIPRNVEAIKAVAYEAEEAKVITVTGFDGNVIQNATYEVFVRILNDGGTLSPENFRFIYGSFVTSSTFTGTAEEIVDGIIDNLNKSIATSYTDLGSFTFTKQATPLGIVISAVIQDNDPAKNVGRPIEFDVQVSVKDNCNAANCATPAVYNILEKEVTNPGNPGKGTGKYVTNLEWFTKGYKYDPYRTSGYPADFTTPYQAEKAGTYNVIHVQYFKARTETNVERQYRTLTIAVNEAPGIFLETNKVLADLRTFTGLSLAELPDLV